MAIPSFQAVMGTGNVVAVITQPAKASGRGRKLTPSPISREADAAGIEVMTPTTLKTPDLHNRLHQLKADIAVVVAYGKILPPEILAVPRLGCVNLHASVLPELRGAAPIQWAIARGYTETGVTLMQMDEGMDTGPVLMQRTTPIDQEETAVDLGIRLAQMGADLLREGLPLLDRGELPAVRQDDSRATYAPLLTKADGLIDWTLPVDEIAKRVRGFYPWPGTYTMGPRGRLLIVKARALGEKHQVRPGTITAADSKGIHIACGDGILNVLAVKPEGKREMTVREFLTGHRMEPGETLGNHGKG